MKKRVRDVQKKFSLDEIDELGFMVVISKPEFEKQIIKSNVFYKILYPE